MGVALRGFSPVQIVLIRLGRARRGIPPLALPAAQLLMATVLLAVVTPFDGLQPWSCSARSAPASPTC